MRKLTGASAAHLQNKICLSVSRKARKAFQEESVQETSIVDQKTEASVKRNSLSP